MTAASIKPAPVRRSLFVKATPEHAFAVFTAGFDRWWPKGHSVGSSPQKIAILEPKVGGRWYEIGEDGSETQWGKVMIWEPPHRVVMVWSVDPDWKFDPGLHTEVEVRFTPEGDGVRVDLEHRKLGGLRRAGRGGPREDRQREGLERPAQAVRRRGGTLGKEENLHGRVRDLRRTGQPVRARGADGPGGKGPGLAAPARSRPAPAKGPSTWRATPSAGCRRWSTAIS